MTKLITITCLKRLQSGENMVSKDQGIGGLIFLICAIVAIGYTLGLFWLGEPFGAENAWMLSFWLIGIPVYLAFVLVLGIGAWIGWTMATTPPPKPIEELEVEEKKEEEQKAE